MPDASFVRLASRQMSTSSGAGRHATGAEPQLRLGAGHSPGPRRSVEEMLTALRKVPSLH
jgi:hypothetical protein